MEIGNEAAGHASCLSEKQATSLSLSLSLSLDSVVKLASPSERTGARAAHILRYRIVITEDKRVSLSLQ